MNNIGRKLRSEKGASITFALLLFLVCAMVSTVVVVAATTAGGRLSNLPDIDRRYYAVSSAAELLGKTLDGQVVTVVRSRERTIVNSYDDSGTHTVITPEAKEPEIYPGDPAVDSTLTSEDKSYSLLTDLAYRLTNNVLSVPAEETDGEADDDLGGDLDGDLDEDANEDEGRESTETFPIKDSWALSANELSGDEMDTSILSVEIYRQLDEDGTLTFYVSKPVKKGENIVGAYTLRLIFAADKTKDAVSHTEHGAPVVVDPETGEYTVTDRETQTTTIKYRWTLTRIEKSVVPDGFPTAPSLE